MSNLTDMDTFKLYQKFSPQALPKGALDDPMRAAEQAEAQGALAFLSTPLPDTGPLPQGLLDRAVALGPRPVTRMNLWKQIVAGVVTFAAFGSGSYALANGLSIETPVTAPLSTDQAGLFEAASNTGFFTYE